MKTTVILSLILFSVNSFALDINKVILQLPQFNFQNNKGSGVIQSLALDVDAGLEQSYAQPTANAAAKFDVTRDTKTMKFVMAPLNLRMKNASDLLTKLEAAQIQNLNVQLANGNSHQITGEVLDLNHQSIGDIHAEGFALTCQHPKGSVLNFAQVIDECLVKTTAHADVFEVPDANSFFLESFIDVPIQQESGALQTLKELELQITKGDFDLSLKVKGIPLVKLKAEGNIKTEMSKNKATIRIDKVKLGFIVVTDLVMKQLKKKLPPENFRTEPPFIYATW